MLVNIALDKETEEAIVTTEYPNAGTITVKTKTNCNVAFRLYDWMKSDLVGMIDGKKEEFTVENNLVIFKNVSAGSTVTICHDIETVERKEIVADTEFTVVWRGCDVVDILPRGEHLRLYQRDNSVEKYYPAPDDVVYEEIRYTGPTQQNG